MYRYLIYNRVSTVGQQDNTSVQHQETLSRAYADAQSWHYAGSVSVQESGASPDRGGIEQVFRFLETGKVDVVVFAKVDRIGRSQPAFTRFFEGIYERGGQLAIATEGRVYPALHELQKATVFQRAVAEHEWLTTNERTQQGKLHHIERGSFLKKPDYGYTLKKELRSGIKVNIPVPLDEEVKVLREFIIPEFLQGTPRTAITCLLNDKGVPSRRRGSKWTLPPVTKILERIERYAGQPFEYSHTVNGTKHVLRYEYPPLIPLTVAEKVRKRLVIQPRGSTTPFRGRLVCRSCGSPGAARGKQRDRAGTGWVHRLGCQRNQTRHYYKSIGQAERVESDCKGTTSHSFFVRALQAFLTEPEKIYWELDGFMQTTTMMDMQTHELHGVEQELLSKRRKLQDQAAQLSGDDFFEVARAINEKLREVNHELDNLSSNLMKRQRQLDLRFQALRTLGITFPEPDGMRVDVSKMYEPYAVVVSKAGRLLQQLEVEDWQAVNELMYELGLLLECNFAEPDPVARQQSVRVSMCLPKVSTTEVDKIYESYKLGDAN